MLVAVRSIDWLGVTACTRAANGKAASTTTLPVGECPKFKRAVLFDVVTVRREPRLLAPRTAKARDVEGDRPKHERKRQEANSTDARLGVNSWPVQQCANCENSRRRHPKPEEPQNGTAVVLQRS